MGLACDESAGVWGLAGEPVNQDTIAALVCVALLIGVPIVILVLRDRISDAFWRRRNPPEKIAADRQAYEARIASPNWPFYERHIQRPAPEALRALYSDRELVLTNGTHYDDNYYISTFEPLDEAALVDTRDLFGFDIVPFANSDGNPIYLRPGPTETDVVCITYHDGGDTEQLAPNLSTFLQRLREANRNADP